MRDSYAGSLFCFLSSEEAYGGCREHTLAEHILSLRFGFPGVNRKTLRPDPVADHLVTSPARLDFLGGTLGWFPLFMTRAGVWV